MPTISTFHHAWFGSITAQCFEKVPLERACLYIAVVAHLVSSLALQIKMTPVVTTTTTTTTSTMMIVINKRCGQLGQSNMFGQHHRTVRNKKNFLAISHYSHVLKYRRRGPVYVCPLSWTGRGSFWEARERVTICCGCMLQFDHRWPSLSLLCPMTEKAKFKNFMRFSWVTTRV